MCYASEHKMHSHRISSDVWILDLQAQCVRTRVWYVCTYRSTCRTVPHCPFPFWKENKSLRTNKINKISRLERGGSWVRLWNPIRCGSCLQRRSARKGKVCHHTCKLPSVMSDFYWLKQPKNFLDQLESEKWGWNHQMILGRVASNGFEVVTSN